MNKVARSKCEFALAFEALEKEIQLKINELKSNTSAREEYLEAKCQFIEDEIDIKVESIKQEAEHVAKILKENLLDMRKELNSLTEVGIQLVDRLEILQASTKNKTNLNDDHFQAIKLKLKELNAFNEQIKNYKIPDLCVSNKIIDKSFIGQLFYEYKSMNFNIDTLIKYCNCEVVKLDAGCQSDIIVLPNNNLITIDVSIKLYDREFNFIREIKKINGKIFLSRVATINQVDRCLYILDFKNHKILMVDFDFKLVKSIDVIGKGVESARGICFKNNKLFVSDYENKSIKIYTNDLIFSKSFGLGYRPFNIKASNKMLCVESRAHSVGNGIYFYHIEDLSFYGKYDFGYFFLHEINSQFYLSQENKIHCFDEEGKLNRVINLDGALGEIYVLVKLTNSSLIARINERTVIYSK